MGARRTAGARPLPPRGARHGVVYDWPRRACAASSARHVAPADPRRGSRHLRRVSPALAARRSARPPNGLIGARGGAASVVGLAAAVRSVGARHAAFALGPLRAGMAVAARVIG